MVERKVYVYDKDIQTLQKMQADVEERVSQHSKIPDAPFNPEVTIAAVNIAKQVNEDDSQLARRLLNVLGSRSKNIVRVMSTQARENSKGYSRWSFMQGRRD